MAVLAPTSVIFILGIIAPPSRSFQGVNQSSIDTCWQQSMVTVFRAFDVASDVVLLCENAGVGCESQAAENHILSVVIDSFCNTSHLKKVFRVINRRRESIISVMMHSRCISTLLTMINNTDKAIGQYGYFWYTYKWILFTDSFNSAMIQEQASNIVHVSIITCQQVGLIHTPLLHHLGWDSIPKRRMYTEDWPPRTVDDIFPLMKYGLNGIQLTVAVKTSSPFVVKNEAGEFSGMAIELLQMIAVRLNFSYVLEEPRDGQWGVEDENGLWTGIIGQMQNQEADIACASITRTYSRSLVMDFTSLPFFNEYRGFMYKRPNPGSSIFGIIFRPLQLHVWLCILSTIIVIVAAFWVTSMSSENDSPLSNKWQCIHFSCATMLSQGSPYTPRSCSGRILSSFLWFFSITVAAVYGGNLTAFLAVSKLSTPFSTLADIAFQSDFQIGFPGGGYSEMFFKTSKREPYMTIGHRVINSSDKNLMHPDDAYHEERIRQGKYIYISDYSYLFSIKTCDYVVQKTSFNFHFNMALRKNSSLTTLVDGQMLRIYQSGLINKLISKHEDIPTECLESGPSRPGSVRMELQSMAGIVLLMGFCLSISILTLILEIIAHYAKEHHWFFWWSCMM